MQKNLISDILFKIAYLVSSNSSTLNLQILVYFSLKFISTMGCEVSINKLIDYFNVFLWCFLFLFKLFNFFYDYQVFEFEINC